MAVTAEALKKIIIDGNVRENRIERFSSALEKVTNEEVLIQRVSFSTGAHFEFKTGLVELALMFLQIDIANKLLEYTKVQEVVNNRTLKAAIEKKAVPVVKALLSLPNIRDKLDDSIKKELEYSKNKEINKLVEDAFVAKEQQERRPTIN